MDSEVTPKVALPTVGDSVWVWFCNNCAAAEGATLQAGCCRHCGVYDGGTRMMLRVEVISSVDPEHTFG